MAGEDKGADTGAADTGAADKAGAADTGDKGAAVDAGKTLADGGAGAAADGAGAAKQDAAATTADWRDRMAGDDKDFRKRLERFADEGKFAQSYRSLEGKLSSGEFKKALPENASAEELTTWRKENGIPDKPEGYLEKLALPNGMVVGEEDKPIVAAFAEMALSKNWSPSQLNDAVAWHYQMQDKQLAAIQEQDGSFRTTTEDSLRNQWKSDYRTNMNLVGSVRDLMPEDMRNQLFAARGPDGRLLGDSPLFIGWLAQMGRELNPAATLLPAGTGDPGKTLAAELADIRKYAQERPDDFEKDKKMQERQMEIIDVLNKVKSRAA